MIESIHIAGIATYGIVPEVLGSLSKFNFIFGSNGSGKTSITRVIANENDFSSCKVNWKGGTRLETLVYNRDFVAKNFNQSSDLKGIFTLGEKNIDTLNKIAAAKTQLDDLTKRIEGLNLTLRGVNGAGGKKGELAALNTVFRGKCWAQKQKHDAKLSGAFEGFRNSADKFRDKVLQESASNSASIETLTDLEKRAKTIFGPTPASVQSIATPDAANILAHELNSILGKRVIGSTDVDIAAMIQRLGNSDWVREGRAFYDANDHACPFCQQHTPDSFAESLNSYFDESFERDSKAINDLEVNYTTDVERFQKQIQSIIDSPNKFLDSERLKIEKDLLDSKVAINIQRIAAKKREPSQVIAFESLANVIAAIHETINTANAHGSEHNNMVSNLSAERSNLTAQVWKYILDTELKADLAAYKSKRDGLTRAISSIDLQIENLTKEKAAKNAEIRDLERETTSIQPTIDSINGLLSSFGFLGFKLAKADDGVSYKLIRQDGTDAKETLSEGERTFVTFLYFFYLLKGSASESGMTTDRVIVIDDPISSLDSDILFIVSSLIKGIFDEIRSNTGHIKQIFVLTHNVYFYKEVTFNPNRRDRRMGDETFWVVRKLNMMSKLEPHESNPIKTTYELLWTEVRRPDRSKLTIQNTLRRILENYFKILGGIDPDDICAKFDGKEKLICKSLFSWVNDGSHSAHDELCMSIDDSIIDVYLAVFKEIFAKTEHLPHYKMMMGDAYVEDLPLASAPEPEKDLTA